MTKYRLDYNDIEDFFFEAKNSFYSVDECGTQILDFSYNYKSIKGQYKGIITDNFKISFGNGIIIDDTVIDFSFEGETVEMHFALDGFSNTKITNMKDDFSIKTNEHNIFYGNDIKGELQWGSKNMSFFKINLQPCFFEKYLPNECLFSTFKKLIQNKEIGFLNRFNYPITRQMRAVICEIIHCECKNQYRLLFLESNILVLLLLQLEQIKSYSLNTITSKKSKTVLEKMYYAKNIILEKINNPMCLSDLAREVNTNECTLKKEFKNLFGTTVFSYIRDVKMQKAKKMLLYQELSVNEVSDVLGYKNPQHFSTAFKKQYGVTPSNVKNIYR